MLILNNLVVISDYHWAFLKIVHHHSFPIITNRSQNIMKFNFWWCHCKSFIYLSFKIRKSAYLLHYMHHQTQIRLNHRNLQCSPPKMIAKRANDSTSQHFRSRLKSSQSFQSQFSRQFHCLQALKSLCKRGGNNKKKNENFLTAHKWKCANEKWKFQWKHRELNERKVERLLRVFWSRRQKTSS